MPTSDMTHEEMIKEIVQRAIAGGVKPTKEITPYGSIPLESFIWVEYNQRIQFNYSKTLYGDSWPNGSQRVTSCDDFSISDLLLDPDFSKAVYNGKPILHEERENIGKIILVSTAPHIYHIIKAVHLKLTGGEWIKYLYDALSEETTNDRT